MKLLFPMNRVRRVFVCFPMSMLVLSLFACDATPSLTPAKPDEQPSEIRSVEQVGTDIPELSALAVVEQSGAGASMPVETPTGIAAITDVVLITGQSNALGSETAFDPVLDQPVDRFYAFTDKGWEPASLRQVWDLGWHPAKGLGEDPHNNFGFHFGKTVVTQRDDRVVGIVLVTAPGEGISHWDTDGAFFHKIRDKALRALNELPHKAQADGILWHQGETDWGRNGSHDPDLPVFPEDDYYSNKLWNLINNFRMESWFASDRPFICGETVRSPVNHRLNALNRDNDRWTACASGEGLPTYDEIQVHFSAEGLRQLGKNYAEIYLQLTG